MTNNLDLARRLRQNQTEAEKFVWRRLRNRRFANFKFRRQMPVGQYVVDFVCLQHRVIVELDGGQHNDETHKEHDSRRDGWLRSQGFTVLRYWNHEVFTEWDAIEEAIWRQLNAHPSPPAPRPQGEWGERARRAGSAKRARVAARDAGALSPP